MLVEQGGVHREQCFITAVLDYAFAFAVYYDSSLLGLVHGVAADVNESLYHVVEGVYVVVV